MNHFMYFVRHFRTLQAARGCACIAASCLASITAAVLGASLRSALAAQAATFQSRGAEYP